MENFTENTLLDGKVTVFQPQNGYRASTDAVFLAAAVPSLKEGASVLDVGSGTGAVSLCLAYRFKQRNPKITGLEIQPELVELANASAQANGFDSFLDYIHCDIKKSPRLPQFDLVLSNPPYGAGDSASPNPAKAAAHNMDTRRFPLEKWLDFCLRHTLPGGAFATINRAGALAEILEALAPRLGDITVIPLFSKPGDAEAKRVIVIGKKGSKSPCRLLRGLTVHNADNSHTTAAEAILRGGKSL